MSVSLNLVPSTATGFWMFSTRADGTTATVNWNGICTIGPTPRSAAPSRWRRRQDLPQGALLHELARLEGGVHDHVVAALDVAVAGGPPSSTIGSPTLPSEMPSAPPLGASPLDRRAIAICSFASTGAVVV